MNTSKQLSLSSGIYSVRDQYIKTFINCYELLHCKILYNTLRPLQVYFAWFIITWEWVDSLYYNAKEWIGKLFYEKMTKRLGSCHKVVQVIILLSIGLHNSSQMRNKTIDRRYISMNDMNVSYKRELLTLGTISKCDSIKSSCFSAIEG